MKGIYEMNVHSPINPSQTVEYTENLAWVITRLLGGYRQQIIGTASPSTRAATIAILLGILLGILFQNKLLCYRYKIC